MDNARSDESILAKQPAGESQPAQDGEFDVGGFIENALNDMSWRIAA